MGENPWNIYFWDTATSFFEEAYCSSTKTSYFHELQWQRPAGYGAVLRQWGMEHKCSMGRLQVLSKVFSKYQRTKICMCADNNGYETHLLQPNQLGSPTGYSAIIYESRTNDVWSNMGISWNRGTPKSSILTGFSIINQIFWGYPIYGTPQMIHIFKTYPSYICTTSLIHRSPLGSPRLDLRSLPQKETPSWNCV